MIPFLKISSVMTSLSKKENIFCKVSVFTGGEIFVVDFLSRCDISCQEKKEKKERILEKILGPNKLGGRMTKKEFHFIREKLQKTQKEMGQLLGISSRAVQSFEQGWRRIPTAVERQAFFLYGLKIQASRKVKDCWEYPICTVQKRKKCPAWELGAGHLCWFISGTLCRGISFETWEEKMKICRKCRVFRANFALNNSYELA